MVASVGSSNEMIIYNSIRKKFNKHIRRYPHPLKNAEINLAKLINFHKKRNRKHPTSLGPKMICAIIIAMDDMDQKGYLLERSAAYAHRFYNVNIASLHQWLYNLVDTIIAWHHIHKENSHDAITDRKKNKAIGTPIKKII